MKNKEIYDVIIQGSMMYNPNDYKIVDKQYLNIRKDLVNKNEWLPIDECPKEHGIDYVLWDIDEQEEVTNWFGQGEWRFEGNFSHYRCPSTPPTPFFVDNRVDKTSFCLSYCDDNDLITVTSTSINGIKEHIDNYNVTKKEV